MELKIIIVSTLKMLESAVLDLVSWFTEFGSACMHGNISTESPKTGKKNVPANKL